MAKLLGAERAKWLELSDNIAGWSNLMIDYIEDAYWMEELDHPSCTLYVSALEGFNRAEDLIESVLDDELLSEDLLLEAMKLMYQALEYVMQANKTFQA